MTFEELNSALKCYRESEVDVMSVTDLDGNDNTDQFLSAANTIFDAALEYRKILASQQDNTVIADIKWLKEQGFVKANFGLHRDEMGIQGGIPLVAYVTDDGVVVRIGGLSERVNLTRGQIRHLLDAFTVE